MSPARSARAQRSNTATMATQDGLNAIGAGRRAHILRKMLPQNCP